MAWHNVSVSGIGTEASNQMNALIFQPMVTGVSCTLSFLKTMPIISMLFKCREKNHKAKSKHVYDGLI